MSQSKFFNCEICGKRLIEKKDGIWHFAFGKSEGAVAAPVDMYISGVLKMKCIRKSCQHWNTFSGVPDGNST